MPRAQAYEPLTFEGPLVENYDETILPQNVLTQLVNWERLPNGGLTPRRKWNSGSETSAPAVGARRTKGMFAWTEPGGDRRLVVATSNASNTWVVQDIDLDDLDAGTWGAVDTNAGTAGLTATPIAFAAGGGYLLYSHPGFTSARIRRWSGSAASDVATTAVAGRALAYHLSRFFSGGTTANPGRLYWSAIADPTSWDLAERYVPVSEADGEPISDLVVFDRQLVIGKTRSLHILTGNTSDSFAVYPISARVGCHPGRSLVSSPVGVFIVGAHAIHLWDGGSEPVSLTNDVNWDCSTTASVSATWIDDALFVGVDNDEFVWKWRSGLWEKEQHISTTDYPHELYSTPDLLIGGIYDAQTYGPIVFRSEPGGERGIDDEFAEEFLVETARTWPVGGTHKRTLKTVALQLRERTGTSGDLTVTAINDNLAEVAKAVSVTGGVPAVFRKRLDYAVTSSGHQLRFEHTATVGDEGAFDIENVVLGWLEDEAAVR